MRVVIAGAGRVGQAIAQELLEEHHDVVLVDEEPRALATARRTCPAATFVQADACELHSIAPAELELADAAISATGEDQVNLVFSLLASQEFGVPRVVARINDPRNAWLFTEGWGIDNAVSAPSLLASAALEAVGSGALLRLQSFAQGSVHLDSAVIGEGDPALDRTIANLGLPMGATVAAIIREGSVVPPDSDQVVGLNDELLLIVETHAEVDVSQALLGEEALMGDVGEPGTFGEE